MRLYGAIEKVEPQDDGTVRVHGIAASETVEDQGEMVRADAIRAALPDYMRLPALREMHQLAAAGRAPEAAAADCAAPVPAGSARPPLNPPLQIWACGTPRHHHRAKREAVKCLEMRSLGAADSSEPPPAAPDLEVSPQREQEAVETDAAIAD